MRDLTTDPVAGCENVGRLLYYHDVHQAAGDFHVDWATRLNNVSAVVVGFGLHTDLDAADVQRWLGRFLEQLRRGRGGSIQKHEIMWIARPSSRSQLKPMRYRVSQDTDHILAFNYDLAHFCADAGIQVFDWLPISLGEHSYDGTHFGRSTNVLVAQLLLNFYDLQLSASRH